MTDGDAPDPDLLGAAETSARPAELPDRAALARELTRLREAAGLSVRDVARRAGLPLATVGGYLSGRHLPQPATMDQFERMLVALGVPDADRAAWVEVASRLRRVPGPRPASARPPYRGLAPYDVDDAELFVGREQSVRALVERVGGAPAHPVVVLAASGSGKSSLLRAGLVAHVRGAGARAAVMTPGTEPAASLGVALAALGEPEASAASAGAGHPTGGPTRLLVVDQLEEVLLADARSAADDLLARLAALHAAGTAVVVGLRADVVERALEHPELARWLGDRPVLVGPLSAEDLRRVVVEPAQRVGVEVDEGLVDVLVAEATAGSAAARAAGAAGARLDPGVLPMVSHALYATWQAASGRRLTLAQYRAVGGLAGAVAQTAESVVAGLPPERVEVARRVLLALVLVRGALATARPLELAELAGPEEADVVAALVDARLLTADRDHVRIAHDALLTAWPRLAGWIEDDREALRVHGRLAEAARHWEESARDDDLLYRGALLETAVAWRAQGRPLSAREHAFLEAGLIAADRRAAARRRSTRRLRALAAGLAVLTVSTGVLAGFSVAQGRVVARERDLAVSRQLAVTAQALTDTDPGLSAQVATAALATADTVEARSALLSTTGIAVPARLGDLGGLVNGLAVSPDGDVVAAATDRATVAVWSVGDRPGSLADLSVDDAALYGVTVTADGGTLLAGGDAGQLRAWSLADPASPEPLPVTGPPAGATLYDVAASADGALVVAAASDGSLHLWSSGADGFAEVASVPAVAGGSAQAVALDPHGTVVAAAGSTGALTLWDVADPAAPAPLGGPVDLGGVQVNALAWSPDGATVAAGTVDGLVRLVDVAGAAPPAVTLELTGPASWVNDLAFSPDGTRLAGASSDQRVWVWDPVTGAAAGQAASPTTLLATRWSPDGAAVYLSGADGMLRAWEYPGSVLADFASIPGQGAFATVGGADVVVTATTGGLHVWDVADPARVRLLGTAPPPDGARLDGAVDVSAAGLVVAGDTTGGIHAWDLSDPAAPVLLGSAQAHGDWVDTVAFDASGTRLAASSDDGTVTLWDVADGLGDEPTGRLTDLGGAVYVVAFSPDATTLVASVLSGSVRLADVTDLAAPRLVGEPLTGPEGYVYSTAFSPDGRTIAATGNDGTLWLWDVSDVAAPTALGSPLRWGEGYGTNTAFAPDGSRVAVAMTDGTVRVWDTTEPARPTRWATLSGAGGTVYGIEFSPDGAHLTGASADRSVRVWDVTVDGALARACALAGRGVPMTAAEWARLAGSVPRPGTCAADGS